MFKMKDSEAHENSKMNFEQREALLLLEEILGDGDKAKLNTDIRKSPLDEGSAPGSQDPCISKKNE